MGYVLREIETGGFYGGQNKKYYDMFNFRADQQFAEVFDNEDDALKIKDNLNKRGYKFIIETVIERE